MSEELRKEMLRAMMSNLGTLDQMWAKATDTAEMILRTGGGPSPDKMNDLMDTYRNHPEKLREVDDSMLAMTSWLAALALLEATQRLGKNVADKLEDEA